MCVLDGVWNTHFVIVGLIAKKQQQKTKTPKIGKQIMKAIPYLKEQVYTKKWNWITKSEGELHMEAINTTSTISYTTYPWPTCIAMPTHLV